MSASLSSSSSSRARSRARAASSRRALEPIERSESKLNLNIMHHICLAIHTMLDVGLAVVFLYCLVKFENGRKAGEWMRSIRWYLLGVMIVSFSLKVACAWLRRGRLDAIDELSSSVEISDGKLKSVSISDLLLPLVLSSFVTMSLFDERVDPTASLTTIALFISSALTIFSLGKMLAKSPIQ